MKIGLISIYPAPNYTHDGISGVASYTKNLATNFPKDCSIIVFANKFGKSERAIKTREQVEIFYCWSRNFIFPFEIFTKIFKRRKDIDVIHIQHEFFIYGANKISAILFIFMVFMLKSLNKPIVITLHHGFLKPSQVNKDSLTHLSIRINPLIFLFGLKIFFKLISFVASCIIIHEKYFKNVLTEYYGILQNKITVIPHGIESNTPKINQEQAKTLLNLRDYKVILYFGYLSKFKGIDLLIDLFRCLKDTNKYSLLIAGGGHPRVKGDKKYEESLHDLKEKAKRMSKNILFTGFVPDEKLPIYFSAADVVVLPYKIVFSSSGALSLAMAYEKLFLVSNAFKNIIETDEFIFEGPQELAEKIEDLFNSKDLQERCLRYSKKIKEKKSWKNVAKKTYELYYKMMRRRL
jgi:glycosyltransferase involved in cell wall biosynthesis